MRLTHNTGIKRLPFCYDARKASTLIWGDFPSAIFPSTPACHRFSLFLKFKPRLCSHAF